MEPGVDTMLLADTVDAGSLRALRVRVEAIGQRHGLRDHELMKFVLVVHELAANAVRHGGGRGEVRVWLDPAGLCCAVTDRGRGLHRRHIDGRRRPSPTDLDGWGLWLVRKICPDLRIHTGRAGTHIAIRYPTPGTG